MWEAHPASFVPHLPSRKGAGDEPIVLRFFVHNAETCARHCYENFAIQDFDDNFRSGMNESGHAQFGLETAAFFRLRSNSEKFRNHCVTPALLTSNEPSSKTEKEPQSNLPCLMMRFTGSCTGGSGSKDGLGETISSWSRDPLERQKKMRRTSESQNRRIESSLAISVMAKLGYAELRMGIMPSAEACDLTPCFAAI